MRVFYFLKLAVFLLCMNTVLAQENNTSEDFSSYMKEVRAMNKMLAQIPQNGTVLTKEGLASTRNMMKNLSLGNPVLKPLDKKIKGPAGTLVLRIIKPDTVRAVVLDIHGGAWSVGNASSDDVFNDEMARTCQVAVVSVEYRLAPEYPFPACIDDCNAAAKWLVENSKKEFGTDKIFISGASAGAHLTATTIIYIRDSLHAISKIKGVNLVYGCFDLSGTPSRRSATDSTLLLYKKSIDESVELVFGNFSPEQLRQPDFSPLFAKLERLPPALFTVGTADPLIDDTYFMESRWRNAGNKTFLAVYPEAPHGFNLFPTKMGKRANERMYQWIIDLSKN